MPEMTVRTVDGVAVIAVDPDQCGALWTLIEPLAKEGATGFVLDLEGVAYLNSMNIAAIISLRSKLERLGANLALANLSEQIASIFRILKLERIFELGFDTDQAVAAVKT